MAHELSSLSTPIDIAAADVAVSLPFNGTPQRYLRISILMSIGIHVWLYGGFSAIKYFVHGETWVFGAKPILITVVSTLLFARFSYRWIMRLDAQYGSGSSWRMVRRMVKLPELTVRPPRK